MFIFCNQFKYFIYFVTSIIQMLVSIISKNIFAYICAFVITLILLVYLLKLPYILTGADDLVNEYYVQHALTNIPLDFLLVTLYLLTAYALFWCVGAQTHQVAFRTVLVALTTILISGFFAVFLTWQPPTSSFFSRWFHRVGWSGVLYDIVLLTTLYLVYRRLCTLFNTAAMI